MPPIADQDGLPANAVISRVGRVLVARLVGDLHGQHLTRFQDELLGAIRRGQARGVVIDLSAIDLLDDIEFAGLRATLQMLELLGATSVLSGLKPALAAALIASGAEVDDLTTARSVEEGMKLTEARTA